MRASAKLGRNPWAVAVGTLLGLAAAACGEDQPPSETAEHGSGAWSGEPQHRSYADRRDDVRVIAEDEGPPARAQVDLVSVELRRGPRGLIVRFRMAAPPGPPMLQQLVILDRRQVSRAMIEVRHPRKRRPYAVARGATGSFRPVELELAGSEASVTAPLTELSRKGAFKWRATTVTHGEVVDRLPDRVHDVDFFPR